MIEHYQEGEHWEGQVDAPLWVDVHNWVSELTSVQKKKAGIEAEL